MKLQLPTWAATGLALLAGLLTVLNETVLQFASPWNTYVTVGLVFAAGLGIGPLIGSQFRAALHLPANASVIITAGVAAATLAATTLQASTAVQAVLSGVLTVLAGLGFAPVAKAAVPAPAKPVVKARKKV